jgi:hypothetical protein
VVIFEIRMGGLEGVTLIDGVEGKVEIVKCM